LHLSNPTLKVFDLAFKRNHSHLQKSFIAVDMKKAVQTKKLEKESQKKVHEIDG